MFAIVTSTTVTIVTTGAAASLGLVAFVLLLMTLIQKEIATSLPGQRALRLSQALTTVVVPLGIAAFVAGFVRVMNVLR